ncbi:MAG: trypsin-like peptidase domain-containing protein [Clostridiaceae bacterium]
MKSARKWICLILILALSLSLALTSASADTTAVVDARNGVVRLTFAYSDGTYDYVKKGSGFFVGIEGGAVEYILTNAHVVTATDDSGNVLGYARNVDVVFDDIDSDSTVSAKVLKIFDDGLDLAILRLEAPTTLRKQLPLRSAESVSIMTPIYALGFPGIADDSSGYLPSNVDDVTITEGKITKEQYQYQGSNYLQVDAAISSGNSGGPLVDETGAVVGINSMVSDPQSGTGLGYALYIDYAIDYFNTMGYPYTLAPDPVPSSQPTGSASPVVTSEPAPDPGPDPKPIGWYVYAAIGVAVAAVAAVAYLLIDKKKKQMTPSDVGYTVPVGKPAEASRGGRQITSIGQTNVLGGKSYPVSGKILVGRDPATCQIVFPAKTPGISGKHCAVQELAQGVVVTDLGSSYGTYLENGTKMETNKPYTILTGEAFFLASKDNGFRVK